MATVNYHSGQARYIPLLLIVNCHSSLLSIPIHISIINLNILLFIVIPSLFLPSLFLPINFSSVINVYRNKVLFICLIVIMHLPNIASCPSFAPHFYLYRLYLYRYILYNLYCTCNCLSNVICPSFENVVSTKRILHPAVTNSSILSPHAPPFIPNQLYIRVTCTSSTLSPHATPFSPNQTYARATGVDCTLSPYATSFVPNISYVNTDCDTLIQNTTRSQADNSYPLPTIPRLTHPSLFPQTPPIHSSYSDQISFTHTSSTIQHLHIDHAHLFGTPDLTQPPPPLRSTTTHTASSNKITVFHQNIQGIRGKIPQIETFLSTLSSDHGLSPDVLCFSESSLKPDLIPCVNIPHFVNVSTYCRPVRQRGGTSIFVKTSLDFIPIILNVRTEEFSFEYCVAISKSREIVVVCIYRSNNPLSDLETFFDRFEELLGELCSFKYIVVCADLNINLLTRTPASSRLRTLLNLFHLKHCVTVPTRICDTTETCIDNIFVNFSPKTLINEEVNIYSGLSDHQFSQTVCFYTKLVSTEKIFTRTFSARQVDAFLQSLEHIDFSPIYLLEDVNHQVNCFYNLILQPFNSHFPFKIVTVGGPRRKKWITRGLAVSCAHKRQLFALCRQTTNPILHLHYKNYCSVLNKVVKQAKQQYTLHSIKCAPKNQKSRVVWDIVRSFSKQSKPVHSQIKLKHQNRTISDPVSIANLFNVFWTNVADSVSSHSSSLPNTHSSSAPPHSSSLPTLSSSPPPHSSQLQTHSSSPLPTHSSSPLQTSKFKQI
uniref:Endonuclease/exonuclease/phosphatase domain-containing protein n=1 Tax=Cacopsylla melanoneura TaxID=428564 RepID=A0A8D9BMS6_9HEMI